jgi:hypothetical protein
VHVAESTHTVDDKAVGLYRCLEALKAVPYENIVLNPAKSHGLVNNVQVML